MRRFITRLTTRLWPYGYVQVFDRAGDQLFANEGRYRLRIRRGLLVIKWRYDDVTSRYLFPLDNVSEIRVSDD